MGVVEHRREEPSLPQVPALAEPAVQPRRVRLVRVAEAAAEGVFAGRHGYEVDVIGHEAVGPHGQAVLAGVVFEQEQIATAVAVVEEHIRASIAALRYVVRHPRHDNSCDPRHDPHPKRSQCACQAELWYLSPYLPYLKC